MKTRVHFKSVAAGVLAILLGAATVWNIVPIVQKKRAPKIILFERHFHTAEIKVLEKETCATISKEDAYSLDTNEKKRLEFFAELKAGMNTHLNIEVLEIKRNGEDQICVRYIPHIGTNINETRLS